jgi:plastocyanin domain-containing protein
MKSFRRHAIIAIFSAGLLYANWVIFSPIFLSDFHDATPQAQTPHEQTISAAVREENGTQIIHIVALHGYQPRRITAKASLPTVLEMEVKSSYDCSAALRIPALQLQQFLKPADTTRITIPPQQAGTTLTGLCSMGMYRFDITFR